MDVLTSHSQCASTSPSQIFTPSQPNISARKKPARRGEIVETSLSFSSVAYKQPKTGKAKKKCH